MEVELANVYNVAKWAFLAALIFGIIANKTEFCTKTAVRDWVYMDDKNMLRSWFLGIGIAILGVQFLLGTTRLDLSQAIYLTPNFAWLGYLVGGLVFGIGMTLSGGCGQRILVRLGNGNLKSLVVIIVFALTANMTLTGLIAPLRINLIEKANIDLTAHGLTNQGMTTAVMSLTGIENAGMVRGILAALIGLGFIVYALMDKRFRKSFDNVLGGVSVGLFVVAGWYITGVVGVDEFFPVRLESYSFVAPIAASLTYLMTFTGTTINFSIAAVAGIVAGSFLYGIVTKKFQIETFDSRSDMIAHIVGGILMGFGGVVALGCTVGQGITGMSTLALGSVVTLAAIIFGSAMTIKVKLYMAEKQSFLGALRSSLADMKLFPSADSAD